VCGNIPVFIQSGVYNFPSQASQVHAACMGPHEYHSNWVHSLHSHDKWSDPIQHFLGRGPMHHACAAWTTSVTINTGCALSILCPSDLWELCIMNFYFLSDVETS
jgi:hypothetical protein